MQCGNSCVDVQSDNNNCGACGKVCGTGQTCSAGKCACASSTTASLSVDIQPIFNGSCAVTGCHSGTAPKQGLSLVAGKSYSNLVGVNAAECNSGLKRVQPGDPSASYLMDKVLGVNLCSGSQMPKAGSSLPKAELDKIGAWICGGALNN